MKAPFASPTRSNEVTRSLPEDRAAVIFAGDRDGTICRSEDGYRPDRVGTGTHNSTSGHFRLFGQCIPARRFPHRRVGYRKDR